MRISQSRPRGGGFFLGYAAFDVLFEAKAVEFFAGFIIGCGAGEGWEESCIR